MLYCLLTSFIFLFKLHDGGGRMCKGGSRENTIAKYNNSHGPPGTRFPRRFDEDTGPPPPAPPSAPKLIPSLASVVTPKDINKMFGITASDIDKYSRMIFPITFVCFQLMYWIIYQHLSDIIVEDLVFLQKEWDSNSPAWLNECLFYIAGQMSVCSSDSAFYDVK